MENTSEAQRNAIFTILSGEGQPESTIFNIFCIIMEHVHEPLFLPIGFEWDIKVHTFRIDVPGTACDETGPIRKPVTDGEVLIRAVLPEGWMFHGGELGSGITKGMGGIKFDYFQRRSSFAYFAFDKGGMAYSYEEAKARYGINKVG